MSLRGVSDPFGPVPLRLIDGDPGAEQDLLRLALAPLGGTVTSSQEGIRGVIVRAGRNDILTEVAQTSPDLPVLVFPSTTDAVSVQNAVAVFASLAGSTPTLVEPAACQSYRFADGMLLAPFSGLELTEHNARVVPAAAPACGLDALVSTHHGAVFLHSFENGRSISLSLVPPPAADDIGLLKDEFTAGRFMGLFALLVFARSALGEAGWRTPQLGASFLVDDPNLRLRRYGFLSFDAILEAARREDFHLSLAMIPIDFAKTRSDAASLVIDNPDRLSIILHGVDHTKLEFERNVTRERAVSQLAQAQVRMEIHEQRTGVPHARVMTFPHGGCNDTWLTALAESGFDAALASRALPFAHDTGLGNALYEMHPAELAFAGFPMINRFKAEEPMERLLFQAWLGKPLIVYTHHQFFRDGVDRVTEIARFLNRHVRPRWQDIGSLVAANYQTRTLSGPPTLRVFSNRVTVALDRGLAGVLKPVAGDERATLNGTPLALTRMPFGLVSGPVAPRSGSAEIVFRPAGSSPPVGVVPSVPPLSSARRILTEMRDQSSPLAAWLSDRALLRRARARARKSRVPQ